jgi:DNA polymerase-3 subunit delta
MAQRVRTALDIAQGLDRGEPPAQIKRRLRMPSRAADRLIADARSNGSAQLQRALEQIADLELASRGGGSGATSEDTAAVRAIQEIAG